MRSPIFLPLLKALRPHQWVKNLLIFAPILLAHELTDLAKYGTLCFAFVLLCMVASSIYVINDILDLEADRAHPVKKNRPFASGALSARFGFLVSAIMLLFAFGAALTLMPHSFTIMLAAYAALSLAYTIKLKALLVVDVVALSFFYSFRILIGGLAVSVPISPWLLAFSWFFFLSLAFVKRFVELQVCATKEQRSLKGRSYGYDDRHVVRSAGMTSGFMSVLVFMLYVATSEQVKALYKNSLWLWIVAPVLVYWLTRTWILAGRGKVNSDPVAFAIKDGASWVAAGVVGALMILGAVM